MSRGNYRNYYKDKDVEKDKIVDDIKNKEVNDKIIEDVKDEEVKDVKDEDVKDEEVKEEPVTKGIVVNCFKLNVRRTANKLSKVLTVIEKGTEVIIANAKTSNGFYKVKVNDIEGYCVKDYIEIK